MLEKNKLLPNGDYSKYYETHIYNQNSCNFIKTHKEERRHNEENTQRTCKWKDKHEVTYQYRRLQNKDRDNMVRSRAT